MKKSYLILALCCLIMPYYALAQSKSFNMAKWLEINNAVLRELNFNYVDSLPVDRMEKVGLDAMLANLDPYTVYIPAEDSESWNMMINRTYGGVGAVIYKPSKEDYLIINEPYRDTPASRAGLTAGDVVLEIEGKSTKGLDAKQCTDMMKGRPGDKLHMKVKKVRSNKIEDVVLTREMVHISSIECVGMLNDTTGYIGQSGFTTNVSSEFKEAFLKLKSQGMKKLVIDLRGNGGGLLDEAVKILSLFIPKNSLVVTAKGKNPSATMEYRTRTEPLDTKIPIIVLVNGGSASASEIVSGALQDLDRATIIGTRTYGKGLVQGVRPLPYNGRLKVTIAKYYTPSGRCVQAIDYAKRDKDGSVKHIPDSLTNEFRTKGGRIVRDGGGITPDVIIASDSLSPTVISLAYKNIIGDYPLQYVKSHSEISKEEDFHLSDKDYEDFVKFAEKKDFMYRSEAQAIYDDLVKKLKAEGLYDSLKSSLSTISKSVDRSKRDALMKYKSDIRPLLESEIIARYHYRPQAVRHNLRFDNQLKKALKVKMIDLE